MAFSTFQPLRAALVAAFLSIALAGCADSPEQQIASAKEDLAKKNYQAATVRLRGLLQENPGIAEARFLLGRAVLEQDDPATAEKELRKASELGYDPEAVTPLLARAMVELGQNRQVIEAFAGTNLSTPRGRSELLVNIGYARLAERDVEGARKAIGDALGADPEYPRAILAGAWLKALDKDMTGASSLVDGVLAKDPDSLEALAIQATFARTRGDIPTALKAYERIAEARPKRVDARFMGALLLLREGRKQEAKAQAEAMRKSAPKHPLTNYLQAYLAFSDKEFPAARDHLAQTLKAAPGHIPTLLLSGIVNAQLGQYELAEQHLVKVLSKYPGSFAARQALIGVMLRTNRADRAVEHAQFLINQSRDNPNALRIAAATYLQAGDAAKAESLFEQAVAATPDDSRTRTGLALARFATGDVEDALKDLEAASAGDEVGIDADVLLVRQYVATKQFDKALQAVATIEQKQPESPATHNLKGEVLLAAKKPPEARQSFETALQLKSDFVPALLNLGRLDLAAKKPEAARKRFEDAVAKHPDNIPILIAYADMLRITNAPPDEAKKVLNRAVAANPKDAGARLALIGSYVQTKDLKRALEAAHAANAAIAGNARLLDALGELQIATGTPDQAVTTFSRAVELAPESSDLFVRLADAQLAQGSTEAALQSLRKALNLKPNSPAASARIAAIELKGGRPGEAVKAARELQKQKGSEGIGFLLEGNVHAREKTWNDAAAAYRKGLELTKSPIFATRLHASLLQTGKKRDADRVATEWIKANPDDGVMRFYLGERALAEKDYGEAMRQYKAALEVYPSNVMVLNNLAWAASQAKDPSALQYAEQAYAAAPEVPAIMDTLGWILVEKGDTKRGIELLEKAVAKAPNAASIRMNYAKALIKAGSKDAARKELDTLAKMGDKYAGQAEVQRLLKEL